MTTTPKPAVYTISTGRSSATAATPEDAIRAAAMLVSPSDKQRTAALAELRAGRTASWCYGFAEVWITPPPVLNLTAVKAELEAAVLAMADAGRDVATFAGQRGTFGTIYEVASEEMDALKAALVRWNEASEAFLRTVGELSILKASEALGG